VNSETGEFNYYYIVAVIIDSVAAFVSGILIIFTFRYALLSGLNQGVMTSMFSLTSIYVALISYWLWDEKLHIFHLYGMIFLVACALLISFSKEAVSITDIESDDISPLWSVLFSILSTM
jgi:drug/metabolite transporter (DMT)-like permease